ncbi:hypothetical protein J6590_082351 [Homalodisca vitripennis]|nr:hypothetical protein J6590_070937 [Homalodisca vitripennis]KAG8329611.1 hypothetical protein J6590_082351 [Homalodisca vitripennis]
MTSSDSDEFDAYTRTAENIRRKRKKLEQLKATLFSSNHDNMKFDSDDEELQVIYENPKLIDNRKERKRFMMKPNNVIVINDNIVRPSTSAKGSSFQETNANVIMINENKEPLIDSKSSEPLIDPNVIVVEDKPLIDNRKERMRFMMKPNNVIVINDNIVRPSTSAKGSSFQETNANVIMINENKEPLIDSKSSEPLIDPNVIVVEDKPLIDNRKERMRFMMKPNNVIVINDNIVRPSTSAKGSSFQETNANVIMINENKEPLIDSKSSEPLIDPNVILVEDKPPIDSKRSEPPIDPKVIVFDDDTGYPTNEMPPIDFRRRYRNKSLDTSKGDDNKSLDTSEPVSLKLLVEGKKNYLDFKMKKNMKVSELLKMCAEELKCVEEDIQVQFDGEFLLPNDVISDLDVEEGDIFHVHIKQ